MFGITDPFTLTTTLLMGIFLNNSRLINYSHALRHISTTRLLGNPCSRTFNTNFGMARRNFSAQKRDKVFALGTWLLVGTGAFVLIGTTTSASLALLLANSLQFQEFVADKLGKWMSRNSGWNIVLSSGIVPNWKSGRITLKDVSIGYGEDEMTLDDEKVPPYEEFVPLSQNYTRFSVQIDRMEVRISLKRWLEGRGWLEEVLIDGARGVMDKRWIRAIEGWKWKAQPGDFDLKLLQLRQVHLSVIQPKGFRPYNVTILSAAVPRLRANWLFYDFLAAESAHGIFDGRSLFTLHTTRATSDHPKDKDKDKEESRGQLKHFRMLGLDVRHLNQGAENALGWVTRGTVDVECFYQLPENTKIGSEDGVEPSSMLADSVKEKLLIPLLKQSRGLQLEEPEGGLPLKFWYDERIRPRLPEELVPLTDGLVDLPRRITERISQRVLGSLKDIDFGGLESVEEAAEHFLQAPDDSLVFQVDFLFRNLRAKLPAEQMAGPRGSLLRPVIGYVNEQRPLIPLSTHFTLPRGGFEGAWSGYESGLVGSLSTGLEAAFQKLVWDPERRIHRLTKIGRWTLNKYLKNIS